MTLVQSVINMLIVFMGGVLALFMLLLFTLHITNSIKSSRIQAMREQLICLISGEAAASRLKSRLYDLIRQKRVFSVHLADSGYPLLRGLLVISETADELQEKELAVLRREIGGEWFSKYLIRQFNDGTTDSIILVIKLVGTLGLSQYVPDVVQQIYCHRKNTHMQHIGLLSLCLLGAEATLVPSAGTNPSRLCYRFERWKSSLTYSVEIANSSATALSAPPPIRIFAERVSKRSETTSIQLLRRKLCRF
ncbi:MAG: hypothetical protein R2881_01775 [Eubacteriales bacterium]